MSVSDLTGTTWVFGDSEIVWEDYLNLTNISFSSNGNTYSQLEVQNDEVSEIWDMHYGSTLVYDNYYGSANWANSAYKTIEFISGLDLTDSDLIDFMEANATQQVEPASTIDYDLTQLSLASGSYTITVRAEASGYADSVDSNSVSYTVASSYDYSQSGEVLTINNAPYSQSSDVLTIGE